MPTGQEQYRALMQARKAKRKPQDSAGSERKQEVGQEANQTAGSRQEANQGQESPEMTSQGSESQRSESQTTSLPPPSANQQPGWSRAGSAGLKRSDLHILDRYVRSGAFRLDPQALEELPAAMHEMVVSEKTPGRQKIMAAKCFVSMVSANHEQDRIHSPQQRHVSVSVVGQVAHRHQLASMSDEELANLASTQSQQQLPPPA